MKANSPLSSVFDLVLLCVLSENDPRKHHMLGFPNYLIQDNAVLVALQGKDSEEILWIKCDLPGCEVNTNQVGCSLYGFAKCCVVET